MASIDVSRVLTRNGWAGPSRVTIEGGVVTAIEGSRHAIADRWLAPGFVDLQVNGIDDIDVSAARGSDWERLDELLLAQGVTTWCPTLVTMPLTSYAAPLARIGEAMTRPSSGRPRIVGAHLEGPFLGDAPGAHPPALIAPVDLEWLAELPGSVAVVTLAAEQKLIAAATALLVERGVLVSIGHSRAGDDEFDAAVDAGAAMVTHLFNAMGGVDHRAPGLAVWAITDERVSASLIADGIHVHPRVLNLAFRALGGRRTVLVTDAVAWRAGRAGAIGIEMRDGAPRLADGTLAGSSLRMDAAVRNCVAAGVDLQSVLAAASTNPTALLRLADRGVIEVGKRADLVALTPALEIEQVWVGGVAV